MGRRGQFIVGAVVFLAVLLIIIQAMVFYARKEIDWTVKEKSSVTAFYLAESGVNRAVWMLKGWSGAFDDVLQNGSPVGYRDDVLYADVPGGSYRIKMTSTAAN